MPRPGFQKGSGSADLLYANGELSFPRNDFLIRLISWVVRLVLRVEGFPGTVPLLQFDRKRDTLTRRTFRYIQHKKMCTMDKKALNEVCIVWPAWWDSYG